MCNFVGQFVGASGATLLFTHSKSVHLQFSNMFLFQNGRLTCDDNNLLACSSRLHAFAPSESSIMNGADVLRAHKKTLNESANKK